MKAEMMIRGSVCAAALLFLAAGAALAQMPGTGAPRMRGVWNPVVGHGAVYDVEVKGEPKRQVEFAVVGTERVGGATGHWMEIVTLDPEAGLVVMRFLYVTKGDDIHVARMIVQAGDEAPMELPIRMAGMAGLEPDETTKDFREDAELVGNETITTPAGRFDCQRYRHRDGSGEVWFSEKVPPYGLVQMISEDTTMTLVRTLTNARSRIRGTPVRLDQRMPRPR